MSETESREQMTLCFTALELFALVLWLGLMSGLAFHLVVLEKLRKVSWTERPEEVEPRSVLQPARRPRQRSCELSAPEDLQ